jgi:hypothetical protein
VDEYEILRLLLEEDTWSDELLGNDFEFLVEKVLGRTERIVLEMKVEGYREGEIIRLTKQTRFALEKMIQRIKSKLVNGMGVDPRRFNLNTEEEIK